MGSVSSSIDKNFYAQQTFAALAIAMQARRDQARVSITCNLALSVLDYPLAAVRRDLISYFYAGSMPGALQEVQEEAAHTSVAAGAQPATATLPAAAAAAAVGTPPAAPAATRTTDHLH